jgi:predicted RNase H-like HicB family nuclease
MLAFNSRLFRWHIRKKFDIIKVCINIIIGLYKGCKMKRFFTLEYWQEDDWFVGKLREIPGIFSQGKTIEELKENIIDAYHMMLQDSDVESKHAGVKYTELGVDV